MTRYQAIVVTNDHIHVFASLCQLYGGSLCGGTIAAPSCTLCAFGASQQSKIFHCGTSAAGFVPIVTGL